MSWPFAARAEQREPVIGLLLTGYANSPEMLADLDAIRQGLLGLGYSEGRNIVIETRYADGVIDKRFTFTADYQLITNPAYNADRGSVSILSGRLHGEF